MQQVHRTVFKLPVRVYWEDTDAGGIVFYANYLKFMERARTEWLRSLGISQQALKLETGGMFVVTDTQLKYLAPARLDDLLIVSAEIIAHGRASLTIRQEISLQPNQDVRKTLLKTEHLAASKAGLVETPERSTPICQGTICIAWVDAATLKPGRIPKHIAEVLN